MTAWNEIKHQVDAQRRDAVLDLVAGDEPQNDPEMTPEVHQLEETIGALQQARRDLGWPWQMRETRAVGLGKRDLLIFQDPPCIIELTDWDPVLPGNRVYLEGKDIRTGEPWQREVGWNDYFVNIQGEYPQQRAAFEASRAAAQTEGAGL